MRPLRTPGRVAAVLAAALLGGGLTWGLGARGAPAAAPVTTAGAFPSPASAAAAERQPLAATRERGGAATAVAEPVRATAAPTGLEVPSLDLQLPVRPYGVDAAGAMALPQTPFSTAWYRYGSGPLDPSGATVVAGHVDTAEDGVGPLAQLGALQPGARIELRVGGRTVGYRVEQVRQVEKSRLDLEALFSRDGPPRLHLVTCGGRYDPRAGGYQANVVVLASRT